MSSRAEVNANPGEFICTNDADLTPATHEGVDEKILERIVDPDKGRATTLMKVVPGPRFIWLRPSRGSATERAHGRGQPLQMPASGSFSVSG